MKIAHYLGAGLAAMAVGLGATLLVSRHPDPQMLPSVAYTVLDGTTLRTEQLRGKVILVNFWATSCAICVHEMPDLVATHREFQARGYDTLAVAMSYDAPANVIDYAQSRALPFAVAIDNTGIIAHSFGDVQATPTTLLINQRGEIVQRYLGAIDFAALRRQVAALLAEG